MKEYSQYTRPDGKRKRKLIQKKSDDPTYIQFLQKNSKNQKIKKSKKERKII